MYKSITDEDSLEKMLLDFQQKEILRRDKEAFMDILKSKSGRWFLMRLLDATGVHADNFTGNSRTFYNEGKRQIGLLILSQVAANGIEAVKLKQKAELEYIEHQEKARELAREYFKEDDVE